MRPRKKKEVKKGWGYPWASQKAHYYVNNQSLCDTSVFFEDELLEDYDDDSPDNCKKCLKKLLKMRRKNHNEPLKVSLKEHLEFKRRL